MKSAIFSSFLAILTILLQVNGAWAIDLDKDKLLKYTDLEVLAKAAMGAEASYVSEELAKGNLKIPGYREKDLKFLVNQMGKKKIDPSFLFNKCIMDDKSIEAILSDTLSANNDGVSPRIGSVAAVKPGYTRQIWHLTARMCQQSQARFVQRLQALTSNGVPVQLDAVAISNISHLVFFPTQYGKPSFKNALNGRLGTFLTVAIITGSIASIFAAPYAGIVISLAVISSSSLSLKNSIPRAENKLRNLEITNISPDGMLKIDFDGVEASLQ